MPQPLECNQCGQQHQRVSGADLWCSDVCRKAATVDRAIVEMQLEKAGFVRVPDAFGLWVKNNVHITTDQAYAEGLEETLARHADAR